MRGFVYRLSRDRHLYIVPVRRFVSTLSSENVPTYILTYIYILYLNTIGGGVKIITNELNYISKIRITLLTKYSYNKTLKIHSKILKKIQC